MRYIRFVVENREPLRIGDDETSQHGQTDTLHYIPGSAVRGMVVQALVRNPAAFEEDKKTLFSNRVHFLNAYPMADGRDLIPSLKGFESRTTHSGKIPISYLSISSFDKSQVLSAVIFIFILSSVIWIVPR